MRPPTASNTSGDTRVGGIEFGKKGDRIRPLDEPVASRQILQVSTVTKQGERDFIKLRPFAKITATLATQSSDVASDIPAYDPLRIFADTSAPEAPAASPGEIPADDQIYGAQVDGEVSVKVSDFPADATDLATGVSVPAEEAEAVTELARREMVGAFDLDPPLEVDAGSGESWLAAK